MMSNPLIASVVIVLAFAAFPLFLGFKWGRYDREESSLSDLLALIVFGIGILVAEVIILWLYLNWLP